MGKGGRFQTQSDSPTSVVKVSDGVHRDTGQHVTEFIVVDKTSGEKTHLGYDSTTGKKVFET